MKRFTFMAVLMISLSMTVFAGGAKDVPEGALGSIATKVAPKMDGMVDDV